MKPFDSIKTKFFSSFILFQLISGIVPGLSYSQVTSEEKGHNYSSGPLYGDQQILSMRLDYPLKEILEKSNDSTYISSSMSYLAANQNWHDMEVDIRIRGGFRRTYCFYIPLRLKIPSEKELGTIFEGNRKMKLVLPCLKSNSATDNLLKEYMAYKIYEVLTPYHFKTRLLDLELREIKKDDIKSHSIKAFLLQDDESFAQEHQAKEIERFIKPQAQAEKNRVINAFFQYMIGNTDFSTVYLHNEKVFYVKEGITPVPYDFDMSGLVNASYAVVSQVQNETLPINKVTTRLYRGYETNEATLQSVRSLYLEREAEVLDAINELQPFFYSPKEFEIARAFIQGFYEVLRDDKKFNKRIVSKQRKK